MKSFENVKDRKVTNKGDTERLTKYHDLRQDAHGRRCGDHGQGLVS